MLIIDFPSMFYKRNVSGRPIQQSVSRLQSVDFPCACALFSYHAVIIAIVVVVEEDRHMFFPNRSDRPRRNFPHVGWVAMPMIGYEMVDQCLRHDIVVGRV